ncbi:MAG TPA: TIGR00282 family metallophosphoesterase [Rectinemataceae bacterium]
MPDDRGGKSATILMLGDVVGAPGLRSVFLHLPSLKKRLDADLVVANGENTQRGIGIGREELDVLFSSGVDVVTTGNHVWERKEAAELLSAEQRLLRPANYPPGLPGTGWTHFQGRASGWIILNLQGREGLYDIDCPFRAAEEILAKAKREHPKALVVVDFHAESTEEKEALAWSLDGIVSAFAGTHTHVQTADDRILPKGTGYITDLGMCGPVDSIIGMRIDTCIRRSLSQIPYKMETAEGPACLSAAAFRIDVESGVCLSVDRIYLATTSA